MCAACTLQLFRGVPGLCSPTCDRGHQTYVAPTVAKTAMTTSVAVKSVINCPSAGQGQKAARLPSNTAATITAKYDSGSPRMVPVTNAASSRKTPATNAIRDAADSVSIQRASPSFCLSLSVLIKSNISNTQWAPSNGESIRRGCKIQVRSAGVVPAGRRRRHGPYRGGSA